MEKDDGGTGSSVIVDGSTQIGMGDFYSCSRQEGRENLQPQIVLIPIAVGAPLNHADFVFQPQ